MPNNPVLSFLLLWSVEVSLLVLTAVGISCFLRRRPGNVQAALWNCVLLLAFILPVSTVTMPSLAFWPDRAVVTQVRFSGFPPEPISPPKILLSNTHAAVIPPSGATPLPADYFVKQARVEETAAIEPQTVSSTNRIGMASNALLCIWLLGMAISIIRWLYFQWKVQRIIRSSEPVTQPFVLQTVERTRQLLFLNHAIQVRMHEVETAPFVIGILLPKILIPRPLLDTLDATPLAAVLSHELAHVKRYDLIAHFFMRLLRTILWFLPPVWWLQHELHRTQDMACDECSAVVLGSNLDFGKALTQLAECCLLTEPVFPALGIIHSKSALRARMENIMSNPIHQLVRLSLRYKLALLMASLTILILPGMVKQAASVQTLQVDYLGNFRGSPESVSVESVFYVEPYYGVVGKVRDVRRVYFFEEKDGQLVESFQARLHDLEWMKDFRLSAVAPSPKRVVLLFSNSANEIRYSLIDLSSRESIGGIIANTKLSIENTLWQGDALYIRDDLEGDRFIRWDFTADNHFSTGATILINPDIGLGWFGFVESGLLAIDGLFDDMDPKRASPFGLAWGMFTSDNQLEVDSKRWNIRPDNPFFNLFTYKNIAVATSFPIPDPRVYVTDWSQKTSPRLIQEITAAYQTTGTGLTSDVAMNDRVLAINDSSTGKQGLLIYDRAQEPYPLAATLPTETRGITLGQNILLSEGLHAFDLSVPSTPKSITFPLESTYTITEVVSSGKYAYAIRQEGTQKWILTLDTAIPSDIKILESRLLPDDFDRTYYSNEIQSHHGLFSIRMGQELHLYELQENGLIGQELVLPPFPALDTFYDLGHVMWNDEMLIIPFNIPVYEENRVALPPYRYPVLHIYKRNGNTIDPVPSSTFTLPLHSHRMQLNGNWLYMFNTDLNSQGDTVPLGIYSLENITRPELVTLFNIPKRENPYQGDPFPRKDIYSLGEFIVNRQYLIYTGSYFGANHEIGVIDIQNPHIPKIYPPLRAQSRSLAIQDSSFVTTEQMSLVLYSIDPEKGPVETVRISLGNNLLNSRLSLSEDRLYMSRRENGLDVYQFKIDSTQIAEWLEF